MAEGVIKAVKNNNGLRLAIAAATATVITIGLIFTIASLTVQPTAGLIENVNKALIEHKLLIGHPGMASEVAATAVKFAEVETQFRHQAELLELQRQQLFKQDNQINELNKSVVGLEAEVEHLRELNGFQRLNISAK